MDAHQSHETAFPATLTARERRLSGRLEGFGDIVFGFAVAQCALQLPTTNGHVDLAQPLALAFYFATFALVATLWLIFHRLMSGTYVPSGIDLFIAFAYLALVSLIPYGMYSLTHGAPTLARARSAVGAYTAIYATMALLAAILSMRNIRRGYFLSRRRRSRSRVGDVRASGDPVRPDGRRAVPRSLLRARVGGLGTALHLPGDSRRALAFSAFAFRGGTSHS
jgi:uncharacterized membrane protein